MERFQDEVKGEGKGTGDGPGKAYISYGCGAGYDVAELPRSRGKAIFTSPLAPTVARAVRRLIEGLEPPLERRLHASSVFVAGAMSQERGDAAELAAQGCPDEEVKRELSTRRWN